MSLLELKQISKSHGEGATAVRALAAIDLLVITNFPDPVFSDGNANFPIRSSMNTHSRQFTQPQNTCQEFIPAGFPYSGRAG